MNYRTKIPIPHVDIIVPVNTHVEPEHNPQQGYWCKINGNRIVFFQKSVVESNPDIFEPERTWTDEEMIEFKYEWAWSEKKDNLESFAKHKGK